MTENPDGNVRIQNHLTIISYIVRIYGQLAKVATRPGSWQCAATNGGGSPDDDGEIFAFVHVYKTAGSTMRIFFRELAHACQRTWISLAKCTGVLPSSIRSRGKWKPCMIEEVVDGRGRRKAAQSQHARKQGKGGRDKGKISNPRIEESVDIFGGHIRLGTAITFTPPRRMSAACDTSYSCAIR